MLLLLEMVPRIWVYLSPKESQELMKQGHREPCLTIPTSKAWIQRTEKCPLRMTHREKTARKIRKSLLLDQLGDYTNYGWH